MASAELLLAVDGAAVAQPPFGVLGLRQQCAAVGSLDGLVVLLARLGEAERPYEYASPPPSSIIRVNARIAVSW
jgi:hypothetical protein